MKMKNLFFSLVLLFVFSAGLQGQSWNKTQKTIWSQVESHWMAQAKKDLGAVMAQLHPDFTGWSHDQPVPDDRQATEKWIRYQMAMRETTMHELKPLEIQVVGNTAVVHYYFVQVSQNPDETHETVRGRFTDVLIRTGEGWKFIAWHGGEED
jgi:ketosteroid isomerase-like protein